MKRHFDEEIRVINERLFKMGLLVEEAIQLSCESLFNRDTVKAEQVIRRDQAINMLEVEIDEMSHEFIALHQPAATDLRVITMVLKITNELERMGDQAVNIAEAAIILNQEPPVKPFTDLPKMSELSRKMVRDALDAFMERDQEKAVAVMAGDDAIDRLNDVMFTNVQDIMRNNPDKVRPGVSLLLISHNLERVADLATNIAEDVVYMTRGVDIRHHIRDRRREGT